MRFASPLLQGILLRRYKRFMADVELPSGDAVTAHVPNSGSMMGVSSPGLAAWISPAENPNRKLKYTLEMVGVDGALVGVNTQHPNTLAAEAIETGTIAELSGYATLRREVKYGKNSRIDLLLQDDGKPDCYVEIKNVHMRRDKRPDPTAAEFPDAVTTRGAKHLREMTDMVAAGARAVMLYVVQREDCASFGIAEDIDPDYDAALQAARAAGVEVICYHCTLRPEGIAIAAPLPIRV